MEGGAAAATIEVLVQNLINVAWDEVSLIRDLDKDAQKLKTSLSMIKSYLKDADKKFISQEEAVKTWLKELEAVAFDADNVLDKLNYHLLSKKVKNLMSFKHKVLLSSSSFNHISRPSKLAHQIKEVNINLESINKSATELGLQSIAVNVSASAAATAFAFETDSFSIDPIFIGREGDVPLLVEKLTIRADQSRKFSIIAIVGMGGMGKTTLTRKVFNHQRIKSHFGSLVWVHVSQTFDPIILFKRILASLTSKTDEAGDILENLQKPFKITNDEFESREVILKRLQKALKDRTCLLVLDDVWNQDFQKWEDFLNSLSGVTSMKGNCIIVTTRNTEVASIVNPLHSHPLNGLSDEECWSIIKAKNFENGNHVPSGFESIGIKIAKRCQGLPLAANVVGGVLRRKSEHEWLSVQQNWLPDVEGDNIYKILRLSFDNLSSPSLKKCFAYCSIFPKGDRIEKQVLIELWMAEGFLQREDRNDMESVGNKFLNVLLHNSLLLVAQRDEYGDVESCVMHDLVHDLASSVSCCSKVEDNINSDGINRVRYYRRHKSSDIPKQVAKYLRTLLFEGEISGIMFSDFKCLHALTITSDEVEELPNSIRLLIHLRNLNISMTRIKYLPEWIGELHHLQTLRADNRGNLWKLPSTVKYLINLRHLYINYGAELPAKIGRLTSLQTLTYFRVRGNEGYKIEELGSLTKLKGRLVIANLGKVHDKEDAVKANIFQKPNLFDLRFEWGGSREGDEINDESVLEGLQPHPNLMRLGISGFKSKRFPLWSMKMAVRDEAQDSWLGLNKLTEITLSYCKECEEIPALGHLPNLKCLSFYHLWNVECINSSFYGIDNIIGGGKQTLSINVFPALERLTMYHMPKLREWAEVETGPNCEEVKLFPHLQYFRIYDCKQLISVPSYFPSCLKELEIGMMDSPIPLANIFGKKLTWLTVLRIQGLDGLECLPDWLFYNNQNLSELIIRKCPKLRELPDGLHTLNYLEKLIIRDCPNLKSVGNLCDEGTLTTLGSLEIRGCPELKDFPCDMVDATPLKTLSLVGLRSLRTLPRVLNCLTKPKLIMPNVEILTSLSLQRLEMDVSMEWLRDNSVAIKEGVDSLLQACSNSLIELELKGMEISASFPESIQNLSALSELKIENFGIEELPEWFGNLSSLKELRLYSCKRLRRLSSVALGRLTKLRYLYIQDCPELQIDSKCLKISTLFISINGRFLL